MLVVECAAEPLELTVLAWSERPSSGASEEAVDVAAPGVNLVIDEGAKAEAEEEPVPGAGEASARRVRMKVRAGAGRGNEVKKKSVETLRVVAGQRG